MIQIIAGSRLFIPHFKKQKFNVQEAILLILSTQSHFQTLGHQNEYRRKRKQEIQGL